MAEMTRERWTAIGLELAQHLEGMRKIAKRNGIDTFSVGIFSDEDKTTFAFMNAGTDEEFKAFEVSLLGNEIFLEEEYCIYKRCIKP